MAGASHNIRPTIQLCNKIIACNFKGSHLYEVISMLSEIDGETLKKNVDQTANDYVNL